MNKKKAKKTKKRRTFKQQLQDLADAEVRRQKAENAKEAKVLIGIVKKELRKTAKAGCYTFTLGIDIAWGSAVTTLFEEWLTKEGLEYDMSTMHAIEIYWTD